MDTNRVRDVTNAGRADEYGKIWEDTDMCVMFSVMSRAMAGGTVFL